MRVAAIAVSLVLAASCFAEERTLSGTVVGVNGKPQCGVVVGTLWVLGPGAKPIRGACTGDDGAFTLTFNWNGHDIPVFGMDATGKLGALTVVQDPAKPVELKLGPLVKVSAAIDRDPADLLPSSMNVQWIVRGKKPSFGSVLVKSRAFELLLPAGDYTVAIAHADLRYVEKDVTVAAGETFDAGTLATELTPIAASYGKPPPDWFAADTRGLPKDVQPAALKGKWVLVEFWGTG